MTTHREAVCYCRLCGRAMTAPKSVGRGIGPECARQSAAMSGGAPSATGALYIHDTGCDILMTLVGGRQATNVWHRERLYSVEGMGWGEPGAKSADLAYNILLAFADRDSAFHMFQFFRKDFIDQLPPEGGRIPAADIQDWIAEHLARRPMPAGNRAPGTLEHGGGRAPRPRARRRRPARAS